MSRTKDRIRCRLAFPTLVLTTVAIVTIVTFACTVAEVPRTQAHASQAAAAHASVASHPLACDVWQIVPSPHSNRLPNSQLLGVSALSSALAWAVGSTFVEGDIAFTLTEQWTHGSWHIIPSPSPEHTFQSILSSVAIVSPHDVWAVGANTFILPQGAAQTDTLIEHWNGRQWRIVNSPNPSALSNRLTSVTAITANDVWAVGDDVSAAGIVLPLAEHWDGRAWHVVPTASLPQATRGTFAAVAAIPGSKSLWAVGNSRSNTAPSFEQALIELWNGHAWQVIPNGTLPGVKASELVGVVALSRTDAWAVGDFTPAGSENRLPLVEHWDGKAWRTVPFPLPDFADRGVLLSVAATKAHDVRVLGAFFAPESGMGQEAFARWDGRAWHVTTSPIPPEAVSLQLSALTADRAGNFWAVGLFSTQTSPIRTLTEHSVECPQ